MRFVLQFNCDNAAFEDDLNAAIAKVLRHCANLVEDHNCGMSRYIKDRNGNGIGFFRVEEDA